MNNLNINLLKIWQYINLSYLLMQEDHLNKLIGNQEFPESINKYSMTFKSLTYEKEFYKCKFEKKNLLVAIGASVYFSMIAYGLRFIQGNLTDVLDNLHGRPITDPYCITVYLWNFPLLFEAIIFFIPRLTVCRGFLFNSLPMFCLVFFSDKVCLNFQTLFPLFIPISIMYIITAVVVCFLYAANWICGAIQALIIIGLLDYYILMFNWSWINNKSILIIISFSTAITIILAIYYFEYIIRKVVFMKLQYEEQKQNLKQMIDNLPIPIIVGKEGNSIYNNNEFEKLTASSPNSSPSRLNANEEEAKLPLESKAHEEILTSSRKSHIEEEIKLPTESKFQDSRPFSPSSIHLK